jgi:dipeptidyl aminopeptidase/acylaminoacyl peptidase
MRRLLPLVAFLLVLASVSYGQALRPTPEDIASLSTASAPQLSPDGRLLLYTLTTHRRDAAAKPSDSDKRGGWKTERQIWLAPVGGSPRQLTFNENATAPRWSPDGRAFAFTRTKNGSKGIHVMNLDGGEARALKTGEYKPEDYRWSPDGRFIAFTASLPASEEKKSESWRSGGAKLHGEWESSHLFVVAIDGDTPRRVTTWGYHVSSFEWSPDGKRFAVVTAGSADPYLVWSLQTPKVISAEDGSVISDLEETAKVIGTIRWSPDGRHLAWERGEGTLSLLNHLAVRCVAAICSDTATRNVASTLDPTLAGFVWSADSRSLLVHAYEKTSSAIHRFSLDGKTASRIPLGNRVVRSDLSIDRSGRTVAFNSAAPSDPSSPTVVDLQSGRVQVVARTNPQVDSWSLGTSEVVSWKSPEGVQIEGVLLTPRGAKGATPLVVLPHGGPDAVTSNDFSSWAHLFAANGYSVLRPNYRGGTGYGFDFYAANRGRLGEIELMDIESGVDSLIAAGRVDPDRLFYGGWSWGGYLTVWTIGKTSRYKAAVMGAGIVDTVLQYVTSDINHGVAAEWEFKGNPWLQPENFARANPLHSLSKITTPTLIIHGDADDRVPVSHGFILYRALRDIGTPVRFLTYPDEPHGFTNPAHTAHMLGEWVEWYGRYRGAGAGSGIRDQGSGFRGQGSGIRDQGSGIRDQG